MKEIDDLRDEYRSVLERFRIGKISYPDYIERTNGILKECISLVDSLRIPEKVEVPVVA